MSHLDAVLAARSYVAGRAQRSASLCHRMLVPRPLAVVMYQLGAEPFSAAAAIFGQSQDDVHELVAGEPRNRDLAFAMLAEFGAWFVPRFEQPGLVRNEGGIALAAPQVVVPNVATIQMLGRLGRRLAYLPLDGPHPADPILVQLGRHLQFLARHAVTPGQQLAISLADLLASHWVTPQSELERASLAALDAFIDPAGTPAWDWERQRLGLPVNEELEALRLSAHGFDVAAIAERFAVGPIPDADDDARLEPLVTEFNLLREGETALDFVAPLLVSIQEHYAPLLMRTWELMWHVLDRERTYQEAPSVTRRWGADRRAYSRHLDWVAISGRTRTRQTSQQAAMQMRRLEAEKERVLAEEACDDPVRMIPYLLDHKAVAGEVVSIDRFHREVANVRPVRRPLVTILADDACSMLPGKQVWWSEQPSGRNWEIYAVTPLPDGGTLVTVKLMTSSDVLLPEVGSRACFSSLHTDERWMQQLPSTAPWPYRTPAPPPPATLEEEAS